MPSRLQRLLLLASMLMSGFCGIIAELSLFNLANSLIGGMNVVLTYTMGVMMFCMGLGALTLKLNIFEGRLLRFFVSVEVLLSLLTASSVPVIFYLAALFPAYNLLCVLLYSACIGYLIGFEIPLILLINQELKQPLRDNSAMVLFADYAGSLIAFVMFSHILLVKLGLAHTALASAGLNWLIALVAASAFSKRLRLGAFAFTAVIISGAVLALGAAYVGAFMESTEQLHYRHKIIWKARTPYQKLVVTENSGIGSARYNSIMAPKPLRELFHRQLSDSLEAELSEFKSMNNKRDLRLFINGGLQFSTLDEAHYHEMLVHPAMVLYPEAREVLIGGGGDGLALREVLKYTHIRRVLLIDLDPEITRIFTQNPMFCALNDSAFHDPRVEVLNTDMFTYLKGRCDKFDIIYFDFPDPHHYEVAKLYSREMYKYAQLSLNTGGVLATQATSPQFTRKAFLIIGKTLESVFPGNVLPYRAETLTFGGTWGFYLAVPGRGSRDIRAALDNGSWDVHRVYLNQDIMQSATRWSSVTFQGREALGVNDLFKPILVRAYLGK